MKKLFALLSLTALMFTGVSFAQKNTNVVNNEKNITASTVVDNNFQKVENEIKNYFPTVDFSKYDVSVNHIDYIMGAKPYTSYTIIPKDLKKLENDKTPYKCFFVEWEDNSNFINTIDIYHSSHNNINIEKINQSKQTILDMTSKSRSILNNLGYKDVKFIGAYIPRKNTLNLLPSNFLVSKFKSDNVYYEIELSFQDSEITAINIYDSLEDLKKNEDLMLYKSIKF